ncbi:MAG: hypothetical protein O2779_00110 [Nanoarchaeota archaeon]|nr:hypothetical protein [Nanoarchaeota archaeon]
MVESKSKVKRKVWVQVSAPKAFNGGIIGEVPVEDPQLLVGKKISCSGMTLLNDMRKQNMDITFTIDKVAENKATTTLHGYKILANQIRRFVRRGKERVSLSILCKTKDDKVVRIKPIVVPITKIKGSTRAAIIRQTEGIVSEMVASKTFEQLVQSIINTSFQKDIKKGVHKIYPIKICELGAVYLESEQKTKGKKLAKARKVEPKEKEIVKEAPAPEAHPDDSESFGEETAELVEAQF